MNGIWGIILLVVAILITGMVDSPDYYRLGGKDVGLSVHVQTGGSVGCMGDYGCHLSGHLQRGAR